MNWAHVTARRAFFLIQWHDTSPRFFVCRPIVHRLRLQAAKSWTEIQNNRYNTRNNAFNSSAEYVGVASYYKFIKQACLVTPKLCWRC
jgi:hypothetical protein